MLRIRVVATLALACLVSFLAPGSSPRAASPDLVISQVYGAGGNTGATYANDFIEIFNRGTAPASLNGLSIQYASATGTGNFASSTSQITELPNVTLSPGQYFLVQEAGGSIGAALPTPDTSDSTPINLSGTAGKVALVSGLSSLGCNGGSTPCLQPALDRIIDLVGYGSANFFEGVAAAPTISATTAALRTSNGCVDTDDNSADFTASAPTPRNSASPLNACGGGPTPTNPSGVGSATPASVEVGSATTLTVTVTPGTNPTSTALTVTGDLSSIGGSSTQAFFDDGSNGDATAGDLVFTFAASVPASVTAGAKTLPVTITDAQARTGSANIALTVTAPVVAADVVISQVYGGGGNSGALLKNDFIELYNQSASAVSLAGWSVQYASSTGTSWQVTPLTGSIPSHGYYLIQEAAGTGGTQNLPTPDASGGIAMAAASGKVALAAMTTALSGSCPLTSTVDFVGYGTANCSEGGAAAPGLSATTAAFRAGNGAIDTDNNAADFTTAAPLPRTTLGIYPSGTGLAIPATLLSGASSLLTVTVTAGDLPPSTGITVTGDLSPIGGSAAQSFFDDGSNGDIAPGDNTYSFLATVTGAPGPYTVPATIRDAQTRTTGVSIAVAIEAPFTPIYTLQGTGSMSPYAGQIVATKGIVTAIRSNGFFIQVPESEADADEHTSNGVFVFTSAAPPSAAALGNEVRVVGRVQEFQPVVQPPVTEISGFPVVSLVSTGNPLPAPVVLQPSFTTPDGGREQLERFEGMRVTADITAITGTDGTVDEVNATGSSNGEFYAVLKGVGRPVREPGYDPSETLPPGAPCCVPAFDGNPEKLRVDSDAQVGAAKIEIVAGQSIEGLTGVLDYGFFAYTILPDPGAYVPAGLDAATPVTMPDDRQFTVASYNLERFFDTENDPAIGEPVLSTTGFDRRLSKASLAIRNILHTPDVLGLIEIENIAALQALANRVNADAVAAGDPDPQYVARLEEGNDIGGIDVGFLVKSSRVNITSVEQVGKDATYFDVQAGAPALLNDRPPLVLRATVHGEAGSTPYPITVIVNHLRSLNGMTDPGAAGQRVREKRRAQAEFLADYIQGLQAADPNERVISVGDYNAFQFNDGFVDLIGTIKGTPTPADQVVTASADLVNPDLVNAGDLLSDAAQYSYTFDGNAQAIDHILMNQAAYKRFSAIEYAHLDADFPESFRSDANRPERLSDHDAAVAYFQFPGAPVITLNGDAEMTVEAYGAPFVDPGATAFDDDLGTIPVTVSGSVDVNTLGTYTLTYSASNGYLTTTKTRTVHVVDTTAPVIGDFALSTNMLWPPTHDLMPVGASYTVTDGSGTATCSLSVESNEPQNGLGDGDTDVDWVVDSATAVELRAERSALLTGRVYDVLLTCVDPSGNRALQRGAVTVPLNSGKR